MNEIKIITPPVEQKDFTKDELLVLFKNIRDKFGDRLGDFNEFSSYRKKDQSMEDYYSIYGNRKDIFQYGTIWGDAISFGFFLDNPTEQDKIELEKLIDNFVKGHGFKGIKGVNIYSQIGWGRKETNVRISIYHKKTSNSSKKISEIKISVPYPPKTIGWWLTQLEEPYRSQALKNWKNKPAYPKDYETFSLRKAIDKAFVWEETPEGEMYWFRLYQDTELINEIKVNKPFMPPKEFPIEINLNNSISIFKYLHDLGYRWTSGRSLIDDYYRDHIFREGDKTFYIYPSSYNSKQLYRGEYTVATKSKISIEKLSEIKVNPPFSPLIIGKKYIIKNPKNIGNTGKIATFEEENDDRLKFRFDRFNLINLSKKNNRDWIKPYKEETNEVFSKEWWKETLDLDEIKVVNPNVPTRFPLKVNKNSWSYVANYLDKKGYTWINGKKLINWDPFIHGKLEQFGINPNKDDIYLAVYDDDGSILWTIKNIHPYLEIPIKDYNTINESSPINFEDDDYQTYITQNRDKIEKAAAFFNLPILDMEDIFLSGKEVVLSDEMWKSLENSKSYKIKTLDDAIKYALKIGIDPKPYIENIKKGEDLPLPLVLCYNPDKYYLVGGEIILSLYRALGSIPTVLQGTLNSQVKEEITEEDNSDKKEKTQKLIKDFIKFVVKEINLKKLPSKINISYNIHKAKENHSFGSFDPNDDSIWLYVKDRAPADFLRTLAHELVHRKQAEDGKIYFDSGKTGSKVENEANAQAGIIMRKFGESNPEIFDGELLSEIKVNRPINYPPNTIGWWLMKLPEPYRSQALKNFKENPLYYFDMKVDNISDAILKGFEWELTPEGNDYWSDFYYEPFIPVDEIKVNQPNILTFPLYIKDEEEFNKLRPLLIKNGFNNANPFKSPIAQKMGITIYFFEDDEDDEGKILIWNSGNLTSYIQEGIYGNYLFGDKESGVKIKWYDKEKEEDTPAEKELFTRLKAYADSEFETYSNMNIDDLKSLFDKLKVEYPDIVNPNLQKDSYIYRGTTTTIDKLEELKQLPNTSEDKRNIIIPNQEYSSQRQLSSWSTNYFNAASFAIATAERKDMVPLIVRAKVKDAELYFNPDFMNKLSSQPEEEVLNSTNPINVDVLIIKGFDTELYDDENLDEKIIEIGLNHIKKKQTKSLVKNGGKKY